MMRTVAACSGNTRTIAVAQALRPARHALRLARRSILAFMTGHSKLSRHVVHPVSAVLAATGAGTRSADVQDEGRAAAPRETTRSRPLCRLPLDGDGVPVAASAEGASVVDRRAVAEEFRDGE